MSRKIKIIIIVVIAVLVVGGAAGAIWYFTWQNGREATFKRNLNATWKEIGTKATAVTGRMRSVASAADLTALATEAESMRKTVESARDDAGSNPPGSSTKVLSPEKEALSSLESYLMSLAQLSATADKAKFLTGTELLANAGFQARLDVTSFMSAVPYVDVNLPVDFYQAGALVSESLSNEGARKADAKAALAAADQFMAADVKQFNIDTIWSLLSTRAHNALALFGITKEILGANWNSQRGADKVPTGYFIDPEVNFTGAETATLKALMYFKKAAPQSDELHMVREGGAWKMDGYLFNGIP
jgi:hypothetical protein